VRLDTMKYTVIAPIGDNIDAIYIGLREFPTAKIILIYPNEKYAKVENAKRELEKFKIPVETIEIKGNMMEDMFRIFAQIRKVEGEDRLLVNVATGDKLIACIALSAAFVNGLKAFGIMANQPILLPVLKFSYYKLISERKMKILEVLYKRDFTNLEDLGKELKMSLPLISYHINGNQESQGLVRLGLIETIEGSKGRIRLQLTALGRLLIKGYLG
jgi:DNA-binding MarR family transcriptional regulator